MLANGWPKVTGEGYASWGCLAVVIMLLPCPHLNKRVRNAMCQAWIWITTKNLLDLLSIKKVMGINLACSRAQFSSQFFPVQAHKSLYEEKREEAWVTFT